MACHVKELTEVVMSLGQGLRSDGMCPCHGGAASIPGDGGLHGRQVWLASRMSAAVAGLLLARWAWYWQAAARGRALVQGCAAQF